MLGFTDRRSAASGQRRASRSSRPTIGYKALERRDLLSRGMGLYGLGGMGGRSHSGALMAETRSFGGGAPGGMFGSGGLGLGGGVKNPIFLLTASLMNAGNGSSTTPSRAVLSSSAVHSAFQTLQSDYNTSVSVGSKPSHASVGQLQDDLLAVRKGTLTGAAATTALSADEAVILTSMGLSSSQVSQIQSDLQAVQAAIASASSAGSTTITNAANGDPSTTTTTATSTNTTSDSRSSAETTALTAPLASSTSSGSTSSISAVPSAFQTLQSDLNGDLSIDAQPTNASIGQVQDDLNAIQKGTLTGSQAVTTIQTDTAAVLSSMGLSQSQITQIQSDQSALATAMQTAVSQANGTTSPPTNSSASPTSIAAVDATMQSVQGYLIGIPGVGGPILVSGGGGIGGPGGPMLSRSGGEGIGGSGGPMFVSRGQTSGAVTFPIAGAVGGPIMVGARGQAMGGRVGQGMGGWQ